MKMRMYKRLMAIALAGIMTVSMSNVSYAETTDSEVAETAEENAFGLEETEEIELEANVSEEVGEKEIEHEPETQSAEVEIDDVMEEAVEAENPTIEEAEEALEDFAEIKDSLEADEEIDDNAAEDNEGNVDENTESENTEPGNAYILTNGTVMQGTIENANEFRWYAFSLDTTSKYSIWLQMENSLDADLYVYKYDYESGQIDLIGGSATDGAGVEEFSTDVLTDGLYYVAISGYDSTGNFAFAYIESTADVQYETNDTADTAASVSLDSDIVGVIDNPYDFDYYSFTLEKPTVVRYSITTEDDYKLDYVGSTGSAPTFFKESEKEVLKMKAGTYTFAVHSPTNEFSDSSYTVRFKKIGEYADEKSVPFMAINEPAGVVYQTDFWGNIGYVNGHLIDISYQYDLEELTNPAGTQKYHISLKQSPGIRCQIWNEEAEGPSVVWYHYSSRPARKVESKPVLELMYYRGSGNEKFYDINCICTGAYRGNTCCMSPDYVIVFIDPVDGKLIDIMEYNYFYQYAAGAGVHNMSSSLFYGGKMSFNYSLFDYVN